MASIIRPATFPRRLTIGGFRRSRVIALAAGLSLFAGAIAWVSNVEPLGVDTSGIRVDAHGAPVARVEATAPTGESFTEFRVRHEPGGRLTVSFWLHNTSRLPVQLRSAGPADRRIGVYRIDEIRVRSTLGPRGERILGPPLTIQADTYVELVLSGHLEGCMAEASTVSFGQVPVEYRLFGVIERHTVVTMPMTVTVTGQRGSVCSAG